jgi:hypothetical protein
MQVIPKANYTLDASERTITLINPYNNIELGQLVKITDLDTDDDIYDVTIKRAGVEVSNGVISYTADSNIVSDTDELRIVVSSADNVVTDHKYDLVDKGLMFRNFHKFDIAIAASADMLIKVGSKYPHILFNAEGDGDTLIQIYGFTTVSADGVEEPAGNFNFNSGNVSLTKWYAGPTVTDLGIYIARTWILGGSGQGTLAGATAAGSMGVLDTVLIPNTNFLLRFTNMAGRALQVVFEVDYKELDYDVS